jgi:hypothetical protein
MGSERASASWTTAECRVEHIREKGSALAWRALISVVQRQRRRRTLELPFFDAVNPCAIRVHKENRR